jgi:hypothetical protein
MNEQEFQKSVDEIKQEVIVISRKLPGPWRSLWFGIMRGFGSVVGAAVAIVMIGFILNAIGVIPAFREQAQSWKDLIDRTQQGAATLERLK